MERYAEASGEVVHPQGDGAVFQAAHVKQKASVLSVRAGDGGEAGAVWGHDLDLNGARGGFNSYGQGGISFKNHEIPAHEAGGV